MHKKVDPENKMTDENKKINEHEWLINTIITG